MKIKKKKRKKEKNIKKIKMERNNLIRRKMKNYNNKIK
jgi:hypothetical protein